MKNNTQDNANSKQRLVIKESEASPELEKVEGISVQGHIDTSLEIMKEKE